MICASKLFVPGTYVLRWLSISWTAAGLNVVFGLIIVDQGVTALSRYRPVRS